MFLVGSFPFNSFLAGIFSSLGFFVLTGGFVFVTVYRCRCYEILLRMLAVGVFVGVSFQACCCCPVDHSEEWVSVALV